jgi:hypothetical protein
MKLNWTFVYGGDVEHVGELSDVLSQGRSWAFVADVYVGYRYVAQVWAEPSEGQLRVALYDTLTAPERRELRRVCREAGLLDFGPREACAIAQYRS